MSSSRRFPRSVTVKHWADNPQLLEKLKARLLELQLKHTEMLSRYEPSYRLVQEVDRQIADTRAAIAAEALTPVRDETTDKDPNYEWARMELEKAQVQSSGLRARQSDADAQIATLRRFAQQMQSDSVEQQALMRTAKAEEDNYLLYLRKREEARIGDALDERQILNVAIVEPPVAAALPTHSGCSISCSPWVWHWRSASVRLSRQSILTPRFGRPTKRVICLRFRCWPGFRRARLEPRRLTLLRSSDPRRWSSEHLSFNPC